jgi:hypothetical protein
VSVWVLVAVVVAVALVVVALLVPVRVRLNLQGKGEPNGTWVLAGGTKVGPAALSGVAARGIEPRFQLHVLSRKLWERTLSQLLEKKAEAGQERATGKETLDELTRRYRAVERRFDPVELVLFVGRERRRIRIERLEVDVEYSFVDIALTGKVLAAIYALSPLLPPPIVVRQTPAWEFVDRARFSAAGSIKVWPGLLVVDSAWFFIRNVRVRRRGSVDKTAREAT